MKYFHADRLKSKNIFLLFTFNLVELVRMTRHISPSQKRRRERIGLYTLWPTQAEYNTCNTNVNILSLNKHPVQQYFIFSVYNLSLLQRFSYHKKEQRIQQQILFPRTKLLIDIVLFCIKAFQDVVLVYTRALGAPLLSTTEDLISIGCLYFQIALSVTIWEAPLSVPPVLISHKFIWSWDVCRQVRPIHKCYRAFSSCF